MLKVLLNRLKPQAEKILAEEQAGFRSGRTATEQMFNLSQPSAPPPYSKFSSYAYEDSYS